MDRRTLIAGLPLLGAAGSLPTRATARVVPGETTWSESAMVLYFDEGLRNGFSLRISRYPDRDATWTWCHVLLDGVLYAYSNSTTPCGPAHTDPEAASAIYPAPGLKVSIGRLGSSPDLKALSFTAEVRAHRGRSGVDGPGDTPISLEGVFHPGALHKTLLPGRFERTGIMEATLRAGGKTVQLSGVGKAHEQTQTAPRFTTPFTYAMLWSPTASMIGLSASGKGSGDLEVDGHSTDFTSLKFAPWSPHRRFAGVLKDGTAVEGTAETVYPFSVPVFGRQWFGRIARAEVRGQPMVGMINDWRPEAQTYDLT